MSLTLKAAAPGLAVLSLLSLGVLATPAHADTPALFVTNTTGQNLANPPFTLGFEFTANSAVNVTAIGLFDDSQNGLAESHAVGLYNSGGTLLASTTVLSGTADPLVNQFRYASVSPVTLTAGQNYFVGGLYTSGSDGVIFPGFATGFSTNPAITFDQSTFAFGGTLNDPNIGSGSNPAYFGPNLLLAPTSVPEPGTLAPFALAGMGLVALTLRARKKSNISA